jgi:hypothetical protein
MVVWQCDTSTASIGGSASNATPRSFTRFGPMKVNGEARSDQKGSVRTFTPAGCSRTVTCPTNEIRHSVPTTRAGGWSEKALGAHAGHSALLRPVYQRNSAATLLGGEPCRSKNRKPLK